MKNNYKYIEVWYRKDNEIPKIVGIYYVKSRKDALDFVLPEFRDNCYTRLFKS